MYSTGLTNEESMEKIIGNDGSASSHSPTNWHAIKWQQVERNVRTTQTKIAKATQESDWRRVKALQRSLTRSFAARALAVRRVTENQGKRTAGVDRELWDTPISKWEAISTLKQSRGYRPLPLRRVYIPKANGKERPLGIPTMKDRAMQALHLLSLEPVVESQSDPNSYGFRSNRSTADAMSQLFILLSRKASAEWVMEADIEGGFDHINPEWVVSNARTPGRDRRGKSVDGVPHLAERPDHGRLHLADDVKHRTPCAPLHFCAAALFGERAAPNRDGGLGPGGGGTGSRGRLRIACVCVQVEREEAEEIAVDCACCRCGVGPCALQAGW